MMRFLILTIALLLSTSAHAATLKLELAQHSVDITTGFNGTQVVLFGTTDLADADIAVTLTGPEKTVIVRKKGRVAGAWMNTDSMEFRRVPSYYDFATSKPESELTSVDILRTEQIGLDNLDFYPEDASEDAQVVDAFRDSLIGTLRTKGFYPLKAKPIGFIEPTFFKITFDLPPGVPTGMYTVNGALFQNQKIVAQEHKSFQVGQVGFNARVYNFATQKSFFYGVLSILLALLSGWSAFTFLRRD